jgi:hypothetical protein
MEHIKHIELPKDVNRRNLGWKVLHLVGRTGHVIEDGKAGPKRVRIASSYGQYGTRGGLYSKQYKYKYKGMSNKKVSLGKIDVWKATTFWKIGKWQTVPALPSGSLSGNYVACCLRGFHCSPTVHAAQNYVKGGRVLALVEYRGLTDIQKKYPAKKAAEEMRIIAAWEMTPEFKRAAETKFIRNPKKGVSYYTEKRVLITPKKDLHQMVTQLRRLC